MGKTVYLRETGPAYRLYRSALEELGAEVISGGSARACGLLLLPGGGDLAPEWYGQLPEGSQRPDRLRDQEELQLVEAFAAAGKPILGICRGMQVINVFFGGTLQQEVSGHRQQKGRDSYHLLYNEAPVLQAEYGRVMAVNSAHHQAIGQLGDELGVLQRSADGIIEGIQHLKLPIIGVQYHPERMGKTGFTLLQLFFETFLKIWEK